MNSQLLIRTLARGVSHLFSRISVIETCQHNVNRSFHALSNNIQPKSTTIFKPLLPVQTPLVEQVCGMKVKGRLHRRCKDCYLISDKGRLYVRCKTHPRHKQAQIVKDIRKTWILTSVRQSKKREWW